MIFFYISLKNKKKNKKKLIKKIIFNFYDNKMKTPKRTECMVCYEEKFMSPCGSQSDCNVYICRDCKTSTRSSVVYYMTDSCYICKEPEWKDGLIPDIDDVINGELNKNVLSAAK